MSLKALVVGVDEYPGAELHGCIVHLFFWNTFYRHGDLLDTIDLSYILVVKLIELRLLVFIWIITIVFVLEKGDSDFVVCCMDSLMLAMELCLR